MDPKSSNRIKGLLSRDRIAYLREMQDRRDKGIGEWCSKCKAKHPKEMKCNGNK